MRTALLVLALFGCKKSAAPVEPLELPISVHGVSLSTIHAPGILFLSASGGCEVAEVPAVWDGSLGMPRVAVADVAAGRSMIDRWAMAQLGPPSGHDDQIARMQAIERARRDGVAPDDVPQRGELVGARAVALSDITAAPLVLASPRAPAHALLDVVKHSGALLGVTLGDHPAVLDLGFHQPRNSGDRDGTGWLELSYDGTADAMTVLDARTGTPHVIGLSAGVLDTAALAAVLAELHANSAADIFVGKQLVVQQLVDWVEALRAAGWTRISLVDSSIDVDTRRAAAIEARGPRVVFGQPNAQGDLDKALIRKVVKAAQDAILACYTTALVDAPALDGTVVVQFIIDTTGRPQAAHGVGVSPALAACVADAIGRMTFPQPKGGGVVQVNYPFTFHHGG